MVRMKPRKSGVVVIVLVSNLMLAEMASMGSRLMVAVTAGLVLPAFACSTEPAPELTGRDDAYLLKNVGPDPAFDPTPYGVAIGLQAAGDLQPR